jgi:hypothetical protein
VTEEQSLWEISAAVDGYNRAHGGEDAKIEPPSDDEFDELLENR